MWNRKELKERGKAAFKRNYWKSVASAVILMVVSGGAAASSSYKGNAEDLQTQITNAAAESGITVGAFVGMVVAVLGITMLIGILWNVFLANPVSVGVFRFFTVNADRPADYPELNYAFKGGRYLKTVGTSLLADIFISLWSLLLVIPGIIKAYEYRMVPYILADNPNLSAMDCLKRSKEMMKGQKWNAFVLDLSFLGWMLLSGITVGLLGIFYVNPYIQATYAELYLELKKGN